MVVDPDILALPKVELHVHIEGTITAAKCRDLAVRNHVTLDPALFTEDGSDYQYADFLDSVTRVYYGIASTLKTKADYEDIAYDYLKRCAAENTIYVEMIACPAQALRCGIAYGDMIDGLVRGMDRARGDFGIESRINVTFEREFALDDAAVSAKAERDADIILSYKHPYITGLDIAGGEKHNDILPFRAAYLRVLRDFSRPLGVRMHAAENADALNAREAAGFQASRIGHGVRIMDDAAVLSLIKAQKIMLEVCPTSNVLALKDFCPTYERHPLRRLYDAGVLVSINSDDPGLFKTTLALEYQIAHDKFGFTAQELYQISRKAAEYAFAPADIKAAIIQRIDNMSPPLSRAPRTGPGPGP